GEIEPSGIGVFSLAGSSGISVAATALEDAAHHIIPVENIRLYHVTEHLRRLDLYWAIAGYDLHPDQMEPVSTFDVAAGGSVYLYAKVVVPADAPGGNYAGFIDFKKGDQVLYRLSLQVRVIPTRLDMSEHINTIYSDPYGKVFSNDTNEVFRIFRETGLEPFFTSSLGFKPVYDANHTMADVDLSLVAKKMDRFKKEGIIPRVMFLETGSFWEGLYASLFGGVYPMSAAPLDLYNKLEDPVFKSMYTLAIHKLLDLARQYNVELYFEAYDEPGKDPLRRIAADRLYTLIKAAGGKTTVTYYTGCDEPVPALNFVYPGGIIPPLTPLIDMKVWELASSGTKGYEQHNPLYSYYTTQYSFMPHPAVNRFLHGLFPFRTDANNVSCYAFGDIDLDPYNDFDVSPYIKFPKNNVDFILAYPTLQGTMIESLSLEGIREGIKDAKYIATLKRLIRENPGEEADAASAYLQALKARIPYSFYETYVATRKPYGFYESLVRDVSDKADPGDYEAFTRVRGQIIGHIEALLKVHAGGLTGDVSGDGRVTMYDAALVLKYTVGGLLTSVQQVQADMNSDTNIDAADAMAIARKAMGVN
ncbi:MAG: dockerin type I repeat-containing protein, partial [Candidatus Omnitrophota bacterium]